MKHIYLSFVLLLVCATNLHAQHFTYSLELIGTNATTGNYEVALIATPDFTAVDGNSADMGTIISFSSNLFIQNSGFVNACTTASTPPFATTCQYAITADEWALEYIAEFSNATGRNVFALIRTETGVSTFFDAEAGVPIIMAVFQIFHTGAGLPTTGDLVMLENDSELVGPSFYDGGWLNIKYPSISGTSTIDMYGGNDPDASGIDFANLGGSTTWNGIAWSNGEPTEDVDAIIEGNYNTATNGSFDAKTLTVNSGLFEIAASDLLTNNGVTVADAIINNAGAANFIVANNAQLLQESDAENVGAITVQRNSSLLYRQDYTLWSSPVSGQNLRQFSAETLFNRFSGYDTAANSYAQLLFTPADVATTEFESAKGYLIRMPNDWIEYVSDATPGTSYEGSFVGVPNNGTQTVAVSNAGFGYNLVGNPYPTPISMSAFFAANTDIDETLYLWRKRNGSLGSGYATVTELGTSSAQPNIGALDLDDTIAVGQGFLIQNNTATTVTFTNAMKIDANAPLFLRNATSQRSRLWLNLSHGSAVVGQTLIGYMSGATEGVDNGIDGLYFDDSEMALTSLIGDASYAIQGRSLPFLASDVVPLQFKTDVAGSYTISLAQFDGLFDADQDIYLHDSANNTVHNLKTSSYTFASETGVFSNRFNVVYEQTTLGIAGPDALASSIIIYKQQQQLMVQSGAENMASVSLYDLSGRLLHTQSGVHAKQVTLNATARQQVLMVKITLENGSTLWKKTIY